MVAICHQHQNLLVTTCPGCANPTSISTIALGNCEECKTALKTAPIISVADDNPGLLFQKIFLNWLTNPTQLKTPLTCEAQLSLPKEPTATLLKLLEALKNRVGELENWENFHRPQLIGERENLESKSSYSSYCFYATALKILQDWPINFYSFLTAYQQASNNNKPVEDASNKPAYQIWLNHPC